MKASSYSVVVFSLGINSLKLCAYFVALESILISSFGT
jgi:hypothetical protein